MQGDATELVRRNKAAFKTHSPAILDLLGQIRDAQSVPVVEDGLLQNIRVGESMIYPAPAVEWTQRQLRGFYDDPLRMVFDNANHCNPSDISLRLYSDLGHHLAEGDHDHLAAAPVVDSGFAFVFGVGLGHHIESLIDTLKVRHFIFIEPVLEFLLHSMLVVDWTEVFRKAEDAGIQIHFVTEQEPKDITRRIEAILVSLGTTFIEGSYFYYHYYSWALIEANSLLSVNIKHHIYSTGFYEDECLMIANSSGNILDHAFRICEPKPMVELDVPVFIVGSGPSLDNDIEYIQKWRSKAVVISCGTTLSILLRHGIRPDIHIELENGPLTPQHISRAAEEFGPMDGIIFAGSITVDPRAIAQFPEAWLLFRGALSPATIFRGPHLTLAGAEPTVSNGGFAVAAASGFRQIYLFGVDCGYRAGGKTHHAKDSIYYHDKQFDLGDVKSAYDRTLPGNFGGTYRASYAFDMTARNICELKRHYRHIDLYNCSDGARIDGAAPKAAAAIDLSASRGDPKATLERVRQQWAAYEPRGMLRWCDTEAIIDGCRIYADEIASFCAEAKAQTSFYAMFSDLLQLSRAMPEETKGVRAIIEPSVHSMMRIAAYYGCRMRDETKRHELLGYALDRIVPLVQEMCDGTAEIFERLRD